LIGEVPTKKPTLTICSLVVGASSASIQKAAKISPFERELMVAGGLTLGELGEYVEPIVIHDEAITTGEMPSAEQMLECEQALLSFKDTTPQHSPVDDMLARYTAMLPSQRLAFARAIGIERCWQPRQRKC
jgi:hypothetical protein